MAVADAARDVCTSGEYRQVEKHKRAFLVDEETMENLAALVAEWSAATEALLSLQTAGRDLVEWEVAYEVIYTGKRRVTAETPMQAEVAVKQLVEDDPTEVDSFPPTVRYSTARRVDGKGKKS